jgi:hypothetical protein
MAHLPVDEAFGGGGAAATPTAHTPLAHLPLDRPVFVHCFNPACKPRGQCRKPAHDFGEEFGHARLRYGKPSLACEKCESTFVDVAQGQCFACTEQGVPQPHRIVAKRVTCWECKQAQCRVLRDFVLNEEDDECSICEEEIEEGTIKVRACVCVVGVFCVGETGPAGGSAAGRLVWS